MNLKRIDIAKLFQILDLLIKNRYRESLIYFALVIKIIYKLSWRDLEHNLKFILNEEKNSRPHNTGFTEQIR